LGTSEILLSTPLYSLHLELGAKMVPFAGYQMPVQYPSGIIQEHLQTRQQAGLFDVSHMGQIRVTGAMAADELQNLLPIDLDTLPVNYQRYTLLTNDEGGVRDDLMICRRSETEFLLIVNAACKADDLSYLQAHISAKNTVEMLENRALLALQGPGSVEVMAELAPGLLTLKFMQAADCEIAGVPCFVTRSGYTGEDGFEISLPTDGTEIVARALLGFETVEMIGLGARDSLRLEAGLCLYGHELDEHISPVEAGLNWAIAQSRRAHGSKAAGFPGAERILQQITGATTRKRVGLLSQEKAPIRAETELQSVSGQPAGVVVSGGYSPASQSAIAMAYVATEFSQPGTKMNALVRGKLRPLEVVELPFVAHRYKQN
jgi:glycine cleavage system T protein (aminomethyltransferase)